MLYIPRIITMLIISFVPFYLNALSFDPPMSATVRQGSESTVILVDQEVNLLDSEVDNDELFFSEGVDGQIDVSQIPLRDRLVVMRLGIALMDHRLALLDQKINDYYDSCNGVEIRYPAEIEKLVEEEQKLKSNKEKCLKECDDIEQELNSMPVDDNENHEYDHQQERVDYVRAESEQQPSTQTNFKLDLLVALPKEMWSLLGYFWNLI